jgi:hypothetical protein
MAKTAYLGMLSLSLACRAAITRPIAVMGFEELVSYPFEDKSSSPRSGWPSYGPTVATAGRVLSTMRLECAHEISGSI